jgi:hypothetical protein
VIVVGDVGEFGEDGGCVGVGDVVLGKEELDVGLNLRDNMGEEDSCFWTLRSHLVDERNVENRSVALPPPTTRLVLHCCSVNDASVVMVGD